MDRTGIVWQYVNEESGRHQLLYNGHLFYRMKGSGRFIHWDCIMKERFSCDAFVVTDLHNDTVYVARNHHSHEKCSIEPETVMETDCLENII